MTAESTTPPTLPEAPSQAQVRRLHRSRTNRVLAGVCGGIAAGLTAIVVVAVAALVVIGAVNGLRCLGRLSHTLYD